MKTLYKFGLIVAFVGNAHAATIAPKITKISVTPTSATAGTMFKFTAELNAPLTTGNKVKIDLGKGLASMTGTKTSYSLSRAIYTTGSQTYKVGIYNAKNVLQGKVSSGNYTVSSSTNNPPTLTLVSGDDSIEQDKVYTLQLKATDSDNNLRSVTVDWKDSSKAETQTATNDATLTFTHTYVTADKFELTATAKDSGTPNLTSTVLSKTIAVTNEIEINNPPTLTLMNGNDSVGQNKVYTLQLKATDNDNNLRSITVDWKDGSTAETQTATNDATLTFTHTYTTVGKFTATATAKDVGTPPLSKSLSKTIDVIEHSYSKVCNSGALEGEEDCPVNPVLGNKETDWACTKDNDTGLIWEVKTSDGGLRDWKKTYTNYTPNYPKCDWYSCNNKGKFGDSTNTDGFIFDVNSESLCGANDWRLPTKDELLGIVKLGDSYSKIDTTYFPNPQPTEFWSSSPYTNYSHSAWIVNFGFGYSSYGYKLSSRYVRLVR